MAATSTTTHEADVRDFCSEYDTPNTRRLIAACEAGLITWTQARGVVINAIGEARKVLA
jgi:hypothetical protein